MTITEAFRIIEDLLAELEQCAGGGCQLVHHPAPQLGPKWALYLPQQRLFASGETLEELVSAVREKGRLQGSAS